MEKFKNTDTKIEAIKEATELAYPNREEYSKLEHKVASLENMWAELKGKASQSHATFAIAVAILAALVSVGSFLVEVFKK